MGKAGSGKLSILSSFLEGKIKGKGWSVKEFAEKADLNEKYAYELLSEGRDFTPGDKTVEKILKALELGKEEGDYILKLVEVEREKGKQIYPGDPDAPAAPGEGEPPIPPPVPPAPVEDKPWFRNKAVIIALLVGFIVGLLSGCCGSTVFAGYIAEIVGYQGY